VAPGVASVAAGERAARFAALLRWADQITHTPGVNVAGAAGAPAAIGAVRAPLPATFSLSASSSSSSAAPAAAGASKKDAKAAAKAAAKKAEAGAGAGAGPSPPAEVSPISECDLRVGKIVEVWKHPGSDKLYCEKIDMGEATGPREIASGLVPYFTLEQMQNRRVVVVANLKPRPLAGFMSNGARVGRRGLDGRGSLCRCGGKRHACGSHLPLAPPPPPFLSAGMVLCATSAEGKVEFVNPPEGAAVGERVTFPGHEGVAAEPNRMAKKKIFEAVAPELVVDDALRATWKGIPFTTTAGPCTVESAKGALIK
jgi:tRNA-binding EMAP/Myf-like protein